MAKLHRIRWKQEDYENLQKAIRNFNSKVDRLKKQGKFYAPPKYSYKEMKKRIVTRYELNRFIKSLRRFTKYGEPKVIELRSGEKITKWEYSELKKQQKRAIKRLSAELQEYGVSDENIIKPFTTQREDDLIAQIRNLKKLETETQSDFVNLKKRIRNIGSTDYELRKATIYRENYLKEMEKYRNFYGYDKLMARLNSIRNPLEFFEYVKNTGNDNIIDLTYQSDQFYTQQEFNSFLLDFGIELYNPYGVYNEVVDDMEIFGYD